MPTTRYDPQEVLAFWFPDTGFWTDQKLFAQWVYDRMQGGMDHAICSRFADLTLAAARGELDHWAEAPRGRLALILVLDQFPRSLWRDRPAAFGQDIKATRLALEGIRNGHAKAVAPWERMFYAIALGHCEGPDHLDRLALMEAFCNDLIADLPPSLPETGARIRAQNARVRQVIERFGRHPHRNHILGRISTPEEEVYIATGDFPHVAKGPRPD
ncbi:DUF924 family protein [Rhodobacter sp. SY28-1]|uniref:DUF924 family protein n=1 Tax=Rhodobacter sp. SY28-1 TaxID=2562317 RepID=UPI0010C089C0|nr:DUF924 family protein [Rhodobacter sp. SY28-1]